MKIITGIVWFGGTIGICTVINDFGEERAYIKTIIGVNIDDDIRAVADYGNTFPLTDAKSLISAYGDELSMEIKY